MEVSTSFLSDNDKIKLIEAFNNSITDYIHFDVMDGKFVKNKFISPKELPKLLNISKKKNDIHLMVEDPSRYIDAVALYDIAYITIHYEIKNLEDAIEKIKSYGFKCGVAISPRTDIELIYPYLKKIDLVLIMSVEPGLGGQTFIQETENKVNTLKNEIRRQLVNTKIEVDGGINNQTFRYLYNADILVSGSFVQKDINNIKILKSEI